MKPGYPLIAALLSLLFVAHLPSPARALERVWLVSSEVEPTPGAAFGTSISQSCVPSGQTRLFHVYVQPDEDVADARDVELLIRINSAMPYLSCSTDPAPPLPPFWIFASPEATCNEDGLTARVLRTAPAFPGVQTLWPGNPAPTVAWASIMRSPTQELYAVDFFRIQPTTMVANVTYYAGTLQLPLCTGAGCPGCDASIEMDMEVQFPPLGGSTGGSPYTSLLFNILGVCATAPHGDPADFTALRNQLKHAAPRVALTDVCDPVQARKGTWGSLKILYR